MLDFELKSRIACAIIKKIYYREISRVLQRSK